MWVFTVWAPRAETVNVIVGGTAHALTKEEGGWWRADLLSAGPGVDYFYSVDGGKPVPDPRSPWQPAGVHGPSRTVDHEAFPWTDKYWRPGPLSDAIIYELHVGTFTPAGTFASTIERLDHLRDLGITHVELMPVCEFSGSWGWGYDGVDLYAPHHAYGGPEGLKRLVDACHARGLAVILDVVYNHLGPAGNYLASLGPYFTPHHRTPWGDAINLDGPDSPEVRRFLCDNAFLWLRDYHIDGLRLDAVHALIDTSPVHFLAQLADEVKAYDSSKLLIAESDWNDPVAVRPTAEGGYGMDAQWSDDFHHALHAVLTGETSGYYADFGAIDQVAKAFTHNFVYDGGYSRYRKRTHGAPAADLPRYRFLAYSQTHDQVGNRAQGDRLGHLVSPGRLKTAAALVLLSPFTPMLFQGEEFAASSPFQYFTQHDDPELARAVSEGRKREYGDDEWHIDRVPDPQDPATFERSKLHWDEAGRTPHRDMLAWYSALIRLRKSLTARFGSTIEVDHGPGWIQIVRGSIFICCNLASNARAFPLPQNAQILLASVECARPGGSTSLLPGESVIVVSAALS